MAQTDANIAVRVGADLSPLQRDLNKAKQKLSSFEKASAKVGGALKGTAVAAGAAAAGFSAFAISAGVAARELQSLATISGISVEAFQRQARVARTVGIEQEQLGDIFKDTNEKLGEFIATGGGGFKDFAERMRMDITDVRAAFEGLSGPQVLGKMKSMLEAANVPLKQQVFFFESVASESSKLIPIFDSLSGKADSVAASMKSVILSQEEVEQLSEMGQAFSNLGDTVSGIGNKLLAAISPELTEQLASFNNWLVTMAGETLPAVKEQAEATGEALKGFARDEDGNLIFDITQGADPDTILTNATEFLDQLHAVYETGFGSITDLVAQHSSQQAEMVVSSIADMANSMKGQSKKMFEVDKAFRLANAVITGYDAATSAWAFGMKVGGPPAAAAFTAASLARTAALVNSIKSTNFGGGGGGGGGGAGSAGSTAVPQQQQQQPENQIVNIDLQGEIFGREQVRGLIGQINDALDDGYTLRI